MKINYNSRVVTTSDKDKLLKEDFSMKEAEKNVKNIQELLATAMYEYYKKNKDQYNWSI